MVMDSESWFEASWLEWLAECHSGWLNVAQKYPQAFKMWLEGLSHVLAGTW